MIRATARIFFFIVAISSIIFLANMVEPILDGKAHDDVAYLPSSDFMKIA